MPLLEVRNLTVSFATRHGAFKAVDGVDVTVDRDEVLAIVGESGSGKSVAMLAVMGLLPFTANVKADRMAFDGGDLLTMSAARSPQDRRQGHRDDLSGADVIAEPLFHGRLPDRRGLEDASRSRPRRARPARRSNCCAKSAFRIPSAASTPFRISSRAA